MDQISSYDICKKKQEIPDYGQVFSQEQLQEYRDIFNKHKSPPPDDRLSYKKIAEALQELEVECSKHQIGKFKHKIQLDEHAGLTFIEFTNILARKTLENEVEDEIRELYREFDSENNGYITASELKSVLVGLEPQITDEQIDSIMQEADIDGDGVLSYEQFVHLCLPK